MTGQRRWLNSALLMALLGSCVVRGSRAHRAAPGAPRNPLEERVPPKKPLSTSGLYAGWACGSSRASWRPLGAGVASGSCAAAIP